MPAVERPPVEACLDGSSASHHAAAGQARKSVDVPARQTESLAPPAQHGDDWQDAQGVSEAVPPGMRAAAVALAG
jgi:hypothetical protein